MALHKLRLANYHHQFENVVQFYIFLNEDEIEDAYKHSNMAVVCYLDPFVTKERIVKRLAFNVPKEVNYYAKDSLRMVEKLFLYAYANAHSINNEEVIMVLLQTGSELFLNAYLKVHSCH